MKVILVALVLLFCVAKAQPGPSPLFAWAGNTFNSSTNFTLPSTSYASDSCVPETSYNSYFVAVNFTITTPGVYEVIALSYYEEFTVQLYLYAGAFDPSDPCTNYTRQLDRENYGLGSEAPTVDDFVYFTPGLYFLVAAGSSFDNYGNFAINVFAPTVTGDNFGSTALWNYTDYDYTQTGEDGCAVNDGPYTAPYVKWVWNQPDSGIYDIIVSWEKNATDVPNSIYTLLYFGNVSDADIQSDDPCIPSSGTSVIIGQNGEYGYSGTTIYGVSLTVKQVYTLVFSGDETDDFGRFSIFVVPTRVLTFHTTILWTPPGSGNGLDSFYSTCPTPDTDADTYAWLAFSWQNTVGETTLVALSDYSDVSGWAGEPDWTYTYLYTGENDGSDVTAPSACPLVGASFIGGWDENVPALIGPINTTYSLVVQDWDGDSINYPTTAVIAFVLTGIPVGSKNASAIISTTTSSDSTTSTPDSTTSTPDSTSTSSSSSSSTSASSTTSSPSSSSSSSSSSSTNSSSTTTSSTSGAETVAASFLFVLLGAFLII